MNYYGSRRAYYRRRAQSYRSRRGASRYSSSSTRRAAGNYRAALQQRDQSSVNLSIPTNLTVSSVNVNFNNPFLPDGNQAVTITPGGIRAINIWDLLRKSTFYQSYANMYDQVKLDRIRVKLTPSSFNLGTSDAKYNAYTVVTAWDRTGLSNEQLAISTPHRYDAVFGADTNNETKSQGIYITCTAEDVASYSSAVTKPVNSGANTSIVRTLYPRTNQEKGLYVNTADIDSWYEGVGPNGNWYGVVNQYAIQSNAITISAAANSGGVNTDVPVYGTLNVINSPAIQRNPAFIGESPVLPWKPTLLIGLLNKPTIDENEGITNPAMTFYVEADIGVSFRGLRKAPVVR